MFNCVWGQNLSLLNIFAFQSSVFTSISREKFKSILCSHPAEVNQGSYCGKPNPNISTDVRVTAEGDNHPRPFESLDRFHWVCHHPCFRILRHFDRGPKCSAHVGHTKTGATVFVMFYRQRRILYPFLFLSVQSSRT